MRGRWGGSEEGVTTIEYTLVLGFMAAISIFVTLSLIGVLRNLVATIAIKIALFVAS